MTGWRAIGFPLSVGLAVACAGESVGSVRQAAQHTPPEGFDFSPVVGGPERTWGEDLHPRYRPSLEMTCSILRPLSDSAAAGLLGASFPILYDVELGDWNECEESLFTDTSKMIAIFNEFETQAMAYDSTSPNGLLGLTDFARAYQRHRWTGNITAADFAPVEASLDSAVAAFTGNSETLAGSRHAHAVQAAMIAVLHSDYAVTETDWLFDLIDSYAAWTAVTAAPHSTLFEDAVSNTLHLHESFAGSNGTRSGPYRASITSADWDSLRNLAASAAAKSVLRMDAVDAIAAGGIAVATAPFRTRAQQELTDLVDSYGTANGVGFSAVAGLMNHFACLNSRGEDLCAGSSFDDWLDANMPNVHTFDEAHVEVHTALSYAETELLVDAMYETEAMFSRLMGAAATLPDEPQQILVYLPTGSSFGKAAIRLKYDFDSFDGGGLYTRESRDLWAIDPGGATGYPLVERLRHEWVHRLQDLRLHRGEPGEAPFYRNRWRPIHWFSEGLADALVHATRGGTLKARSSWSADWTVEDLVLNTRHFDNVYSAGGLFLQFLWASPDHRHYLRDLGNALRDDDFGRWNDLRHDIADEADIESDFLAFVSSAPRGTVSLPERSAVTSIVDPANVEPLLAGLPSATSADCDFAGNSPPRFTCRGELDCADDNDNSCPYLLHAQLNIIVSASTGVDPALDSMTCGLSALWKADDGDYHSYYACEGPLASGASTATPGHADIADDLSGLSLPQSPACSSTTSGVLCDFTLISKPRATLLTTIAERELEERFHAVTDGLAMRRTGFYQTLTCLQIGGPTAATTSRGEVLEQAVECTREL